MITENVLTNEKKLAWQSSRLAPLVWVLAPVMMRSCPSSGLRDEVGTLKESPEGYLEPEFWRLGHRSWRSK